MAVTSSLAMRPADDAQQRVAGPAMHVLCGACYLFVAMAFAYLDRSFGRFGFEAALWLVWAAVGFGAGAFWLRRPGEGGRRMALWLTVLAGFLVFVPGLLIYALPRWPAFAVLLIVPARAAAMQRRKDVYLCLVSLVAVSLLVATHSLADWTLWFYLAPAWVLAALVLAWDYSASVRLGSATKVAMTLGFLVSAVAIAMALWAVLPRPDVVGFGFVPAEAGPGGKDGSGASPKAGGATGAGAGGSGASGPGATQGPAQQAMARLRQSLRDPNMPALQRQLLEATLDLWGWLRPTYGQGAAAPDTGSTLVSASDVLEFLAWLLALLALALAAFLVYRWRWRIAIEATLGAARVVATRRPDLAIRCVQLGARMALHRAGHRIQPGQSVREHVGSALDLPVPARRWLRQVTSMYCACRFGGARATAATANEMRRAVVAALEVIEGRVPGTTGRK